MKLQKYLVYRWLNWWRFNLLVGYGVLIVAPACGQKILDLNAFTTGKTLTEIPREVFDAKDELVGLDLSRNKLGGLTREMSTLHKLEALYLVESFDSLVPVNVFQPLISLKTLRKLSVSGKFIGNTNLNKLIQLEYLYWHGLESFPVTFCDLVNLSELYIASPEEFSSLPTEFTRLTKLETLKIRCSGLRALPEDIGKLVRLRGIDLKLSDVRKLPVSFIELQNLEVLDLEYCGIESLPDGFGKLRMLSSLNLAQTSVKILPRDFTQLENLKVLDLRDSPITQLPADIGNLKKLEYLLLGGTFGLKYLPASLGQLTSLNRLDLNNSFLPEFPSVVFELKNLRSLYVYERDLQRWKLTKEDILQKLPRCSVSVMKY